MGNIKIDMPNEVKLILNKLNTLTSDAYIVGGCVRDSLLNKTPNDWDICTSCSPDKVKKIFADYKIVDVGIKHGTVAVIINNKQYEITTYRIDGDYEDNRHPSTVQFTKKLEDDLSRRDFTINAMAYNESRGLVDLFGGRSDLENGIIKCVGNPDDRFNEDALRIIRAERFALRYGFEIDLKTEESMMCYKWLLKNIAIERITSEFNKAISDKGYVSKRLLKLMQVVIPEYLSNAAINEICLTLSRVKTDRIVALAFIHRILLEHRCRSFIEDHTGLMRALKYSNKEITTVLNLLYALNKSTNRIREIYCGDYVDPKVEIKRFFRDNGEDLAERYFLLLGLYSKHIGMKSGFISDYAISLESVANEAKQECHTLSELKIKGNDVIKLGFEGKAVGLVLNMALDKVISGEILNDRLELMDFVYAEYQKYID